MIALLLLSTTFGGMVLFSFGFAVLMFKLFDKAEARRAIRGSFPYYYLAMIVLSALCGAVLIAVNWQAAVVLGAVAVTTLYARQSLMHRINAATDAGQTSAFKRLHGVSVVLQLAQIAAVGWAIVVVA